MVRNSSFVWDDEETNSQSKLNDINFTVRKGSLIAVVGHVGAGKSSLLSALLGEMEKEQGRVMVSVGGKSSHP